MTPAAVCAPTASRGDPTWRNERTNSDRRNGRDAEPTRTRVAEGSPRPPPSNGGGERDRPASRPRWRSSPSSRSSRFFSLRDPSRPAGRGRRGAPRGRDPARARLDLGRGRVWTGVTPPTALPSGPPPSPRAGARSALHRWSTAPLRRPTMAADRRPQPLRELPGPGRNGVLPIGLVPGHADLLVPRGDVQSDLVVQRRGDGHRPGRPWISRRPRSRRCSSSTTPRPTPPRRARRRSADREPLRVDRLGDRPEPSSG